nr:hypothetical protein [Shouchella patagoniensis]
MSVKLIPYLMMNGNAKDAIQFYEQALNASVSTFLWFNSRIREYLHGEAVRPFHI